MFSNIEPKSGVYSITNPKGAVYVGSSVNIKRRFNQYKYLRNNEQQENPNSKKVIDKNTGAIYTSIKEAALSLDINYSTLKAMLQGYNPNKTSIIFLQS